MSEQENIAIVQKWIEALNAHEPGQFDEHRGTGYVFQAPVFPGPVGVEEDIVYTRGIFEAFPDLHVNVEEIIAQGDSVVVNFTMSGTHDGPLALPSGQTVPATGKKGIVPGSNTFKLANGKIVRNSLFYDQFGMMAQLGLVPEM
jgi:steroid delta-isomerase-like uncharacterized protein